MYLASSNKVKISGCRVKGLRAIQGVKEKTDDVFVVIGKDVHVKNDFSGEIELFCKRKKFKYSYDMSDGDNDFWACYSRRMATDDL